MLASVGMLLEHAAASQEVFWPAESVHPFATVYANGVRDPHSTGVLVTRHNETHFYVLAVEGGPVECLLYRAPGEWTCPYPPLPKSAKSS